MLEVQVTEVKDDITKDRNMTIWKYFQDPPIIQSINMTEIPDNTEEDLEDRIIRFQYDGDLKFDVTFFEYEQDKEIEPHECYLHNLDESIDSFHVIEYLKLFDVRVNLWNELFGNKCNRIDESRYSVSVTNKIGLEQTPGFASFYDAANEETKIALRACSDLAPPTGGKAEGPCIESVEYDSISETSGVRGRFATGRPTIYEKDKTRNMHFSVIGKSGVIDQYTASIFISGLYSKGPGKSLALPTHEPILVLRDPPGGNSYASFENIVTTARVVSNSTQISGSGLSMKEVKAGIEFETDICTGLGVSACAVSVCYVPISKISW